MKKWLRRLLGTLLGLLLVLTLLLGLGLALLQTDWARAQILRLAEQGLREQGLELELQGLDGFLPFSIELRALDLADRQGTWLEVRGLRLAWSPGALLTGRVVVEELSTRRIGLARVPELPPAPEPEPEPEPEASDPPQLPEGWPPLVLERLELVQIQLGAPLLGEAAEFSLVGQARARSGGLAGFELQLLRLDQPTAELNLEVVLDLIRERLRLDLDAQETGGLLAGLLQQPGAGPWHLGLHGDAPWDDWSARLALEAGGLAKVESSLRLGFGKAPYLGLEGGLNLDPALLPAELTPVWDGAATLVLDLRQTGAQRWQLQRLRLDAGPSTLEADAELDWDSGALTAQARLGLADLATLVPLTGSELAGALALELTLGDRLDDPRAELVLSGDGLQLPGAEIAQLESRFHARLLGPLNQGYAGVRLDGQGGARRLRLAAVPEFDQERLDWELDLEAPAEGPAELRYLRLRGGPLHADLAGEIDPASLAGKLSLEAGWDDLAQLAAITGTPLAGALVLTLGADLSADLAEVLVDLRAAGSELQGLPPAVAVLVGAGPELSAKLELRELRRARLQGLQLDTAGLTLSGDAETDLETQALAGRFDLLLPDLAPLGEALASPMAGNLALQLDMSGSTQAPELALRLRGRELLAAGVALQDLDLDATAADLLNTPAGGMRLRLGPADEALALASDFKLQGQQLELSALSLAGPETELQGGLSADLAGPLVEGRLSGAVEDLAALGFWHRTPGLAGSLTLDLQLSPQAATQDLRLKLDGVGLSPGVGHLETLGLNLALADLFGQPALQAELLGQGFAHPDLPLERIQLKAEGTLADFGLGLDLNGDGELIERLNADARMRQAGGRTEVELATVDGRLLGRPLRLQKPALLVSAPDRLAVDGLDLQFGDGSLLAAGELGRGKADLRADIQALELAPLARLGGLVLDGRADAQLRLTGKPERPEAVLELKLSELSWPAAREQDLAPTGLNLQASVAGGRLRAELVTKALGEESLRASATLPVEFALQPFAFVLADKATLDGGLSGRVDLARLSELLVLDNQVLAGVLRPDLRLSGTLDVPGLDGTLSLSGGRYENGLAGVLIEDIELVVEARGRELVLTRLSASDGEDGSLSGDGRVALGQAGELIYQLGLRVQQMELVRSPDASATLSGGLDLSGDQAAANLTGTMTLDQAEILIPEGGGPDVPELEVVEVHSREELERQGFRRRDEDGFALQLDLGLDVPGRAFVRGRGLESEWRGALQVKGDAHRPQVLGELRVHRGWLDFLDRRFTLAEGVVDFHGGWPPIPDLRIRAESQGREILGIINVTGPADDPELALESEPALPEDEVLARLLFDQPLDEITPAQALRLASALRALSGGGGGLTLMDEARGTLGLDTLDFEAAGAAEGSVKAGKYLREDVYLEVIGGLGEGGSRARVEWDLTPSISVETSVDQESRSAFGLNWKIDY